MRLPSRYIMLTTDSDKALKIVFKYTFHLRISAHMNVALLDRVS